MKKKFLTIISLLLCISFIFSLTACSGKKDNSNTNNPSDNTTNSETTQPSTNDKEEIKEETPEMKQEIEEFWEHIKPESPSDIKSDESFDEGDGQTVHFTKGEFSDMKGEYVTVVKDNTITSSYFSYAVAEKESWMENDVEVVADDEKTLREIDANLKSIIEGFLKGHPNYIIDNIVYTDYKVTDYKEHSVENLDIDFIIKKITEQKYQDRWFNTIILFVPTNGGDPITFSIQTSSWYNIWINVS